MKNADQTVFIKHDLAPGYSLNILANVTPYAPARIEGGVPTECDTDEAVEYLKVDLIYHKDGTHVVLGDFPYDTLSGDVHAAIWRACLDKYADKMAAAREPEYA